MPIKRSFSLLILVVLLPTATVIPFQFFLLYCRMLRFFISFLRMVSTIWYNEPAIKLCLSIRMKIICKVLNNRLIRRKFLHASAQYPNNWLFPNFHASGSWLNFRTGEDWKPRPLFAQDPHIWRRKWQPTPVFLPGESQGRGSLVGGCLWGRTEWDTTEAA